MCFLCWSQVSKWRIKGLYIYMYFFFFSFIFISWRLITLQYCSGFYHTLTWISHGFIFFMRTFYKLLFTWNFVSVSFYVLVVSFGNALTYCVEFYHFSTSWLLPCDEALWSRMALMVFRSFVGEGMRAYVRKLRSGYSVNLGHIEELGWS